MIGSNKKQLGFTLTEVLVTVFVFSTVLVALVGTMASVLTAQRRITAQRKLEQNVRYSIEEMARKVRTSKIDYPEQALESPAYKGAERLNLTNAADLDEDFFLQNQNINLNSQGNDIPLLDGDVRVTALKFYIHPEGSPYFGGTANEQSRVTIYLEAETTVANQTAKTEFQTTISSRIYER